MQSCWLERLRGSGAYAFTLCMQNDLEFLRIRSFKHEIMVAASKFFLRICFEGLWAWGILRFPIRIVSPFPCLQRRTLSSL